MKFQKGNAALVALIGVIVIICIVALGAAASYVSAANEGNRLENQIKATYENNQNILAQYGQKVMEAVQVPEMAKNDLMEVAKAAISGRYGPDGARSLFTSIQEQNPQVDPQLYRQIQQIIEAGRNQFETAQTRLIDQKAAYLTALGTVWKGFWMRLAGYPRINLDDYKIVTTDRAANAFQTGKEAPIQLRPSK
ncbi:hypothetical protein LC612_40755 [Nostoc sp. CHAB 5834]|nr:hypothetical protein [Nostoc sp. CHAB 5834]